MRVLRESGWYCDGTVRGQRTKLVRNQRIEIDGAVIKWPGGNLDNLVMSRTGWLAGSVQRGQQDWAIAWDGSNWRELGKCFGRNACAFHPDGTRLYVCADGSVVWEYSLPYLARLPSLLIRTGALGIRNVTTKGKIVTCEATYNEPTHTMFEFTDCGDIRIGHGNDGVGCLVKGPDGVVRVLERGEAKFINAHRDGDQFCIAFHREDTNESVWCWPTRAELLALPPLEAEPEPTEPEPIPQPEDPPMAIWTDAHTALLHRFNTALPVPQRKSDESDDAFSARRREWTGWVARQFAYTFTPAWGHKRADPNRPLSEDVIAYWAGAVFVGFDLINGGTGQLNPRPGEIDLVGQVFVPVPAVDFLSEPADPVDPPDPPPVDPPEPLPADRLERAITAFCKVWLGVP